MRPHDVEAQASRNAAIAEVASLVASEAVALCEAVAGEAASRRPALQRAAGQAREVLRAVADERTDERTAAWALSVAAVALTEARAAARAPVTGRL